jgi:hypothetical protein
MFKKYGQAGVALFSRLRCNQNSDVLVIVSRHGSGLLKLVEGLKFLLFNPVSCPIFFTPKFFYHFLRIKTDDRLVRYIYATAKICRTKVILSTDAISQLTAVKNMLPNVEIIAIMHGLYIAQPENEQIREAWTKARESDVVLFSLGSYDLFNYRRWGNIHSRIIPVGSLNDSIYRNIQDKSPVEIFDLCIVEAAIEISPEKEFNQIRLANWLRIVEYVNELVSRNKLRVIVALSKSNNQELIREWFHQRLGSSISFVESNDEFGTYRAIDSSKVSIGDVSTSLIEALGRGNKIISLNFSDTALLDLPVHAINRMNKPTYAEFEERYQNLVSMDQSAYLELTASETFNSISYDSRRPTHIAIRSFLESAIQQRTRRPCK